ncbi:M48 family metallopeptidase [Algibacter sp.]|nr:SprT family zinc-dependent metalloprotease [Algibacter sp.]MDA9069186.1 M48 family metallopeptidase [Algibacter sp.]MDC1365026.1 M48 family metallopeptidase [Algibacter sp.]
MSEQLINIDGVEVTFFKSDRAKSLNITIKPFTGVRVSVPKSISFKKAKTATKQRIGWIKTHLSKMQKAEDKFTVFTFDTEFKTRFHHLEIKYAEVERPKAIIRGEKINVLVPLSTDIKSTEVQLEVRKGIERTWRKEAKEHLPKRVEQLAKKHDFKHKSVSVRNSKTRWGSCSNDNSINLSLHLMRLPDYLIDYVILHELVHTKIKNHSKDFWHLLDSVSGNAKKLDREVKGYGIQIY